MGSVGPKRATRSGSPPVAWMPVSVMPGRTALLETLTMTPPGRPWRVDMRFMGQIGLNRRGRGRPQRHAFLRHRKR